MQSIEHWIGGSVTPGTSGRQGRVFDPAVGRQTKSIDLASSAETDMAVQCAVKAETVWRESSLSQRAEYMFRLRELISAHREELAVLISQEHGKVVSDAAGEVARGLECVEFACGLPQMLKGSHSSQVSNGVDVHTVRHPVGVVAGITPFNFPVMVPLWMTANALACGNAFILKPSEKDPSPSMLLAKLVQEAGFPDGVFNVLHGDVEAVDAILNHPDVDAISFVGSTPVAQHIYEVGTRNGKRVQALGGAKNHMVVMPDADLDSAADAAVSATYGSAGERCMAISVVVAVEGSADSATGPTLGDRLISAIGARIPDVMIGSGVDPKSMMGPLITAESRDRVTSYVQGATDEGAEVVVDGTTGSWDEGFFTGCSLIDHVKPGMKVYEDEIFGPVLGVVRVQSFDEAVALINANAYGNGVALFTRDGGAARQFEREVTVGMVG